MLFFLASAIAGTPITSTYLLSDGADPKAPAGYQYSAYTVKQAVWVAGSRVYLQAEGALASKAGQLLPPGTAATITAVGTTPEYADGKMDVWYQVASPVGTGWVHGGALTPFGFSGDFDQDGETELATVSFNPDFSIRVMVIEPNPRAGAEAWISVDSAGGAYISAQGSVVSARLLRAKVASLPLIHVHTGVEACADFADSWISYRAAEQGVVGTMQVALALTGLADAPNLYSYEVKFDPKRKTANVTTTLDGEDEKGRPTHEEKKSRYDLISGVYREEKDGHAVR